MNNFEKIENKQENKEQKDIKLIEEASFIELSDKMDILLVYLKNKPAAFFSTEKIFSEKEYEEDGEEQFFSQKIKEIKEIADKLNLFSHKENFKVEGEENEVVIRQVILIAQDLQKLENLKKGINKFESEGGKELGIALGYPKSAAEAFAMEKGGGILDRVEDLKLLSEEEKDKLRKERVFSFLNFGPSKEHWREELEQVRIQQKLIKEKSPVIYSEVLEKIEDPLTNEGIKLITHGVWAERLNNNQELPVGGAMPYSKELTIKLKLDFETFDEQLEGFTEEAIKAAYERSKDGIIEWLKKCSSDIDPYTYFFCYQVQQKMKKLLEVNYDAPNNFSEREKMYEGEKLPKLSEFKGKTMCAERAALGQYILQKLGIESAYVSGVLLENIDEFPQNHSFIVLKHPIKEEKSLIFDIARPRSNFQFKVPRILETNELFTYELLKDKEDFLAEAKDVLQGGKLWFGVRD